jgi:hypothetical protein
MDTVYVAMRTLFVACLFILFTLGCIDQKQVPDLEQNFNNPPAEFKPRTWFHAMSGNMSKPGLTKDLEVIGTLVSAEFCFLLYRKELPMVR